MTVQATQLLIGFALAASISIISVKLKLLDLSGCIASTLVGSAVFGIGGLPLSVAMIWFFVSSNLLGKFRKSAKNKLGFQKPGARDAGQVFANGGVAAICCLSTIILPHFRTELNCAALASIASSAADTWATEIGSALNTRTVLITTFRLVRTGQSGGVSFPGSIAALAGAATTACAGYLSGFHSLRFAAIAILGGVIGCTIDSLMGAALQRQFQNSDGTVVEIEPGIGSKKLGLNWITNDVVNFSASTVSALAGFILASNIFK